MKIVLFLLIALWHLDGSELEIAKKACAKNDIKSCYKVAVILTTGKNKENQEKNKLGIDYMRKACIYGEINACDDLGKNYYNEKSYIAARPYLHSSCLRDDKNACEQIGTIYRDGHDVRASDVKARFYYEKACELGNEDACINVALMYRGGFGVDINRTLEKKYYQKACKNGSQAGCGSFTKLDNKDKGIKTGFFDFF